MMILPTIAVFIAAQRYFVHGVVLTGVQGCRSRSGDATSV